jgi:hypothetical protein
MLNGFAENPVVQQTMLRHLMPCSLIWEN